MNTESAKKAVREYQKRNPEKILECISRYQKRNRDKVMYWRIKTKCKKKNIPFDLEMNDIVIPDICPVLGVPIIKENPNGLRGPNSDSPSLDRINPSLGYIKGNVRVISARANTLKSNATLEELRLVLYDLENINMQTGGG